MLKRTKLGGSLALAISAGMFAIPSFAQQAQELERVEVTGSAIKRIDAETALPVTVIRVDDLVRQGVTSTEQALQRVAANQTSFTVTQSVGATTGGKAEADLRGLSAPLGNSANKTLILLNGRRLANHPFDASAADLTAIPLAAVDRIEVLRDGASALYGTDAIGGVINFILKRDYKGYDLMAQTTQPSEKGGDIYRVNGSFGFGSLTENGFNVIGTVDLRKQRVVEAKNREFAKTGIVRGAVVAGTSGTSFPGDLNGFEPTLPTCAPPNSIPNPAGTACRYDYTADIDIVPKNSQITTLLRGQLALGPNHTLGAEWLRAQNDVTSRVAAAPTSHYMPASSPFFPAGAPLSSGGIPNLNNPEGANVPGGIVNWRQIPAGKRQSEDNSVNQRLLIDASGSFGAYDYHAAIGRAKSRSVAQVSGGYVNDSLMQQGVFDGVINPFGAQTAAGTAAIANAQVIADTMIGVSTLDFVDARVSGELFKWGGRSVGFAVGAEHRREKSSFVATDITAELGSLGIDPNSDTAGSRRVTAAFAEVSLPVLKELEVSLAGRYDRYSDFGSTFNPKVGVRYQPISSLILRGSANKGFRAPSLYEIYQPASLTFTSDNYDDPLLCPGGTAVAGASPGVVCGQQVLQRTSGPASIGLAPTTLQPEKATSFTAGLVFEPMARTSIGLDFWSIKVKNLISAIPEQSVFGSPTANASRFVRCGQVDAAQRATIDSCLNYPSFDPIAFIDTPIQNLGEMKTHGLDLSVNWRSAATSVGTFGVNLDGTYVMEYKYQLDKGGEYIDAKGRYTGNAPIFKWQHVLGLDWKLGQWSALLQQRYKSGYVDQDGVNKVKSYMLHDLAVTWEPTSAVRLTAGISNLFDKDPPLTGQSTTFQRGYDPRFTDPLGRAFSFAMALKFN